MNLEEELKDDGLFCRFCFESRGELILPCKCFSARTHRACLDRWRAERPDVFARCEICHFEYEMEMVAPPAFWKSYQARYLLQIVWIIVKAVLLILGGISFWGVLCYYLDEHSELQKKFAVPPSFAYFIWGVLFFFLTVDLYGVYYYLRKNGLSGCTLPNPGPGSVMVADGAIVLLALLVLIVNMFWNLFCV
jgi:hypothetical protein